MLEEEYTAVRQGNSEWMVHALFETAVKLLGPVIRAYQARWVGGGLASKGIRERA
jgi:hypothetical protein